MLGRGIKGEFFKQALRAALEPARRGGGQTNKAERMIQLAGIILGATWFGRQGKAFPSLEKNLWDFFFFFLWCIIMLDFFNYGKLPRGGLVEEI